MEKTVYTLILDALKEAGFEVYPPVQKNGECKSKYIVVKQAGAAPILGISSQRVYYMFLLYAPRNEYTQLDKFESDVRYVLDTKLFPMLMPTGSKENDYYDDNFNAHLRTFTYRNNVRDKHL